METKGVVMRSTVFVIISIAFHALCVAAVALAPQKISQPGGEEIEVQLGEAAEQPGLETAPEGKSEAAAPISEPEVVKAEPVKPEPVKAEPVKPEPVKKAEPVAKTEAPKPVPAKAPKKAKPVVATAVPVKSEETPKSEPATELPAKQQTAEAEETLDPEIEDASVVVVPAPVKNAAATDSKPVLTPVKEKAPEGVEADNSKEEEPAAEEKGEYQVPAAAVPVKAAEKTAPAAAPVAAAAAPAAAAVGKGDEHKEDGELAKGGATKAGAVSYLDLKQAPGNRSPLYPLAARKDKRQGQVELLYRVTKEGKVTDVQVAKSSGHKDLDGEAVRAISQFKFVPGQEGWARHPVSFALKGDSSELPGKLRSAGAQE